MLKGLMLSGQVECAAGTFKRRYNATAAPLPPSSLRNLPSAAGPSLDGAPETRLPTVIPAHRMGIPACISSPAATSPPGQPGVPPKAHALQADPLHLICLRSSKREAVVCGWAWPRTERRPLAKRRSYTYRLVRLTRAAGSKFWSHGVSGAFEKGAAAVPVVACGTAVAAAAAPLGSTSTLLSRNSFNSNSHKCVVCA